MTITLKIAPGVDPAAVFTDLAAAIPGATLSQVSTSTTGASVLVLQVTDLLASLAWASGDARVQGASS